MKKRIKAKTEISHRKLNLNISSMAISGRYAPVGFKRETTDGRAELVDKVIFPMNVCPHCQGKATFHSFVQYHNDIVGNIWKAGGTNEEKGEVYMKFDFCFDCQKEFLVELYLWKKIKKEVKKL